jgi:hypothetical protein
MRSSYSDTILRSQRTILERRPMFGGTSAGRHFLAKFCLNPLGFPTKFVLP